MSKDNQDQCFEVAAHEQQIREIAPQKTNLLGQANPIYTKKIEQSDIDYDGSIALKILPPLQFNDINNYTSFKIANKNKEKESATKQEITIESGKQKEVKEQGRIKFFTSQQNHFLRYFQKDEIIYCKFNNSKHNIFKEVSYFAGVFLPRDVLRSKITNTYREQKIVSNIGELIQSKAKNRLKSSSLTNQAFLNKKNSIQFDSKFESGNLFSAFKTGKNQFHLVINNDINSKGSTQWFYFSVQGMESNVQYTFNIVNFTKNDSLFNYGMKPVYYSVAQNNGISPHDQLHAESNNKGWYRFGKDVSYFKGQIQRQNSNKLYYTLSFKISNKFNNDKIYLAHSYPYTYTRAFSLMRNILNRNHKNEQEKKINKTKIFCNVQEIKIGRTIANRQLLAYLISPKKPVHSISKQCIIILARQHPGQTQGSFVCEGIIKLLTQHSPIKQVKFLLENYQIYVVPMVNPDGVIFGNYRTNLSGKDLNRKWDSNDSNMSNILLVPEVVSIRDFLTNLTKNGNMSIRFILDLHGHSKKLNSFFYGNPNIQNPQLTKIYPYICSRFSEAVQFMDCTFSCQQYKKRAARVYLSSAFQQMHVYTFESSFYGYRNRQGKIIQFTPTQYAKLGQTLIKSLYLFLIREKQGQNIQNSLSKTSNENEQPSQIRQSIQTYLKLEKQLKEDQILIRVGDDESSGSESRPEQGQLNNEQIVYESEEEEEVDNRVIVSSKPSNKQANQKSKAQVSKTKSIRINSRKTAHQNTIEYKQMSKQYRNKKLITISQVNGVLADKYHISLLPIQRVAYRSGKKVDAQAQTQRNQKIAIRSFKQFQIEEKSGLTGYIDFNFQEIPEEESHCGINGPKGLSVNSRGIQQQKRHSQIVAQIQKNGRSLAQRSNYQTEKQLIGKRKLSQIVNISQAPSRNQRLKKRQIFTQTMATFKNFPVKQPTQMDYLNQSIKQKELQSESRIAQMEKINREVLRIYSKKSTIIDLGARPKGEKSMQKSYKQFKMDKLQVGSNKRY